MYVNKLYNLDKKNKFLEKQTIKLTQEEIDTWNKCVTSKRTDLVIFKNPHKKIPVLNGSLSEFYKTFKKIINTNSFFTNSCEK